MTEPELRYFVEVVTQYFATVTGEAAQMGIPYVKKSEAVVMGHTGLIGISGPRKGAIYFTAGNVFLQELARCILDSDDADDETLLDLVGELTNTIAGNLRQSFGPDFLISVPLLVKGKPDDILMRLTPPVFVIPLLWRRERAFLVVGLE